MKYRNYRRRQFQEWRLRTAEHLPKFVTAFYASSKYKYKGYEKHILLGKVITGLNNPFYSISENGKRLDEESEMALEIILEMQVKELFSYIKSLNTL